MARERVIKLTDHNRKYAMEQVKNAPSGHEIAIRKQSKAKTLPQLRLAFLWVSVIREFFIESEGKTYTTDQIRAWLNGLFLNPEITTVNGRQVEISPSWAKMKKDEFSEFMDKIDRYCIQELELYLPLPVELDDGKERV